MVTKGQELGGIYKKLSDGEQQENIRAAAALDLLYQPCICSPALTMAPFILHLMMNIFPLDLLLHLPKSYLWYRTSSGGLQTTLN